MTEPTYEEMKGNYIFDSLKRLWASSLPARRPIRGQSAFKSTLDKGGYLIEYSAVNFRAAFIAFLNSVSRAASSIGISMLLTFMSKQLFL